MKAQMICNFVFNFLISPLQPSPPVHACVLLIYLSWGVRVVMQHALSWVVELSTIMFIMMIFGGLTSSSINVILFVSAKPAVCNISCS